MSESGEMPIVEQTELSLDDTLSQALDLWKQGKDSESGKLMRKASKMFVNNDPNRSYVTGADEKEKNKNCSEQNYDSPVTKTILQMVEQRTLSGTDQFTSIFQIASAITPEYTDNTSIWDKTDYAKTIEELLSVDGVACRHQANLTSKLGLIMRRNEPQENWSTKIVAFPRGFEVHGQVHSDGHRFTAIVKGEQMGLIDITNPHLTFDGNKKVIQGDESEVLSKLFKTYKEKGISIPKLTMTDSISYQEKEILPPATP